MSAARHLNRVLAPLAVGAVLAGCASSGSTPVASPTATPPAAVTQAPDGTSAPTRAAITGLVTFADGRLATNVMVSVTGLDGQAVPELAVLTGPDGRYSWPGLAPGRYAVRVATTEPRANGVTQTIVPADGTATADITLRS
ncbi:MAG: carboxypeptidase regulatory-like domain-containing protein [Tetrasphaera sp.]|jgi:hypothetical protein|nr:carboxypeptidase regulatory-like domain-containing protein [Tetrasphaera sp.]